MKEKFIKEYLQRLMITSKSKLHRRNKNMAINTWTLSVLRYRAGTVNQNANELKSLDIKIWNSMAVHGALHPKSDVDRI